MMNGSYPKPSPTYVAFRIGMAVGMLLVVGVFLLTKATTGWVPICL